MQTIVEPKQHIDELWGKQKIRENETYRLMNYVLRADHEGKVLLHNVVTGQLVVLDQSEADAVDRLPQSYSPEIEQLVSEHYLVPEEYDEHQQVTGLRNILWRLYDAQKPKEINHYTILPTTACNARCYYCFEQGCKALTMTERTADEVINYIDKNRGVNVSIQISWFGGEPLLASQRIDQISKGLRARQIDFQAEMTTNGYLFDEQMVDQAKAVWNLKKLMITVDGTEDNYNKIKSFVGVTDNPYQRVMRNIALLIDKEIYVTLRMNYDLNNYLDFYNLIDEVKRRFATSQYLRLYVHPIVGEFATGKGERVHASDTWFEKMNAKFLSITRAYNSKSNPLNELLPHLSFVGCQASDSTSATITPEGFLVRCPEQFDCSQFTGSVQQGITCQEKVSSWKQFSDFEKCVSCTFFPFCGKVVGCAAKDRCTVRSHYVSNGRKMMIRYFSKYKDGIQ